MSHSAENPATDPLDETYVRRSGSTEDAWDTLARVALLGVGGLFLLVVVGYAVWLFVEVNR